MAAVTAALALYLALTQLVSAQVVSESERTLFEGPSGPYTVKVTQSPPDAIVGSVRIIVEPVETATGEPVTDAIVRVFGNPSEEGERQYSPALNNPRDPSFYIAQLELEDAGEWIIEVEVDAEPGRTVVFGPTTIRERARSGSSTLVGTILFILISVGFVGSGLWLWFSSKKARARKAAMIAAGRRPKSYG